MKYKLIYLDFGKKYPCYSIDNYTDNGIIINNIPHFSIGDILARKFSLKEARRHLRTIYTYIRIHKNKKSCYIIEPYDN